MLAFNTCHLPGWRTDVKHIDELFWRQAKVYCDKETLILAQTAVYKIEPNNNKQSEVV